MQISKLAVAIALGCSVNAAFAEEATPGADIEHVEVSSRVITPVRELATSVSVMTEEDIELRGYANLAEVLRIEPSVNFTDSGGIGSTSALRIRGEEGFRTLIRVDGVDISDPTGTQVMAHVGQLQSANVSRVEILRGTQGLVYGADAGGVINVQSGRFEQGTYGGVRAEAGAFDTRNLSAEIGHGSESVEAYLSVSDYSTDGINALIADTELADEDGYENTTVHAKVSVKATDALTLGFVARNNQGENEFDNCWYSSGSVHDCLADFEQSNLRLSANYALESGNQQLAYTKTLIERENFALGESSYFAKGTVERVEYLADTRINAQHTAVYGIDWEQEAITSSGESRTQTGYYGELQSEWVENLFTTAGLRYDDNQDFGEHVSYRLSSAYIWNVQAGEMKLRGAYGTGFRAPSLYEIQYNRDFGYAPASEIDLKEEESEGYEIGLQFSPAAGTFVEVVYFDQQIEDSIVFDGLAWSGYLQELGKATSEGIELIGQWTINDTWTVKGNYTYNETQDTSGNQRARRPRNMANLSVLYRYNALVADATVRVAADAMSIAGVKLDDYALLDLSARYDVTDNFSVFGRIENAFDKDFQSASAYRSRGRAANIGVNYTF